MDHNATTQPKPEAVEAMSVSPEFIQGSVCFSLGRINTIEDVNYVIKVLPPTVERLRKMLSLG